MHDITEEAVLKREHFRDQSTTNSLAMQNRELRLAIAKARSLLSRAKYHIDSGALVSSTIDRFLEETKGLDV